MAGGSAFKRLSTKRIVSLWVQADEKMTMSRIARILATEGIFTTHQTVRNTITRWQKTGSVRDLPRSGPLKRVPEIHYCCIDEAMTRNDELTASGLKDTFSKRFGAANVLYSVRTIARLCNELVCTTLKQDCYKVVMLGCTNLKHAYYNRAIDTVSWLFPGCLNLETT